MIYFIQAGKNGPIKIGKTENGIEGRLQQLQTGCPYELKLLWVYYGNNWTESGIHKFLKSENIRGEWFHPSTKIFEFIDEELCNEYTIQTNNLGRVSITEFFKEFYIENKYGVVSIKENGVVVF